MYYFVLLEVGLLGGLLKMSLWLCVANFEALDFYLLLADCLSSLLLYSIGLVQSWYFVNQFLFPQCFRLYVEFQILKCFYRFFSCVDALEDLVELSWFLSLSLDEAWKLLTNAKQLLLRYLKESHQPFI